MKKNRPGTYAVRAVNQYRRRDILPYLGLRYYLDNSATLPDTWAKEVAVDLVLQRSSPSYLTAHHFKDVNEKGIIGHREMYLPGPNEALAEAVLIDACSNAGKSFNLNNKVFSYIPAKSNDLSGVFGNYMFGLRARHDAISATCRANPNSLVQFFDIKRFYPSIKVKTALAVWRNACATSGISYKFQSLGEKLLDDHSNASHKDQGKILTGPMFSHLIGNLVLSSMDMELSKGPASYFRYVDDVVLVGTKSDIEASYSKMKKLLEALELELHGEGSQKCFTIKSSEWLEGEGDYAKGQQEFSWMTLVGDIKRLLLWYPDSANEMKDIFTSEGFRLPLPDYSEAVRESSFITQSYGLIKKKWFQRVVRDISPSSIINQARILRKQYDSELMELIENLSNTKDYPAKRMIPKARYRLGRLTYLSTPDRLDQLSQAAVAIPSLYFHSEVAHAVASGELDRIVELGSNAAQAVAQPLHMSSTKARLGREPKTNLEAQALSILAMNGVEISIQSSNIEHDELYRLAKSGVSQDLMMSKNGFVQEISCLHGLTDQPRHLDILSTAFDEAEDIALDAIEQARPSLSL